MNRIIIIAVVVSLLLVTSCSFFESKQQSPEPVNQPASITQQTPAQTQQESESSEEEVVLQPSPEPTVQKLAGFQVQEYVHPVYKCSILYPSTWERSTSATDHIIITFDSPDSFSHIKLCIYPSLTMSADRFIEIQSEMFELSFSAYNEISRVDIPNTEYGNAVVITSSYLFRSMNIVERDLWLKNANTIFSVNCIAAKSEFDAYSKLFDGVIDSFKIVDK